VGGRESLTIFANGGAPPMLLSDPSAPAGSSSSAAAGASMFPTFMTAASSSSPVPGQVKAAGGSVTAPAVPPPPPAGTAKEKSVAVSLSTELFALGFETLWNHSLPLPPPPPPIRTMKSSSALSGRSGSAAASERDDRGDPDGMTISSRQTSGMSHGLDMDGDRDATRQQRGSPSPSLVTGRSTAATSRLQLAINPNSAVPRGGWRLGSSFLSVTQQQALPPKLRWGKEKESERPQADVELFQLVLRVFTLFQSQSLQDYCLSILQQLALRDPPLLISAMGFAARRLDHGPAYAASALSVLVRFVNRFPHKVPPWLPMLTEAVLRCLEPSDPTLRRASLQAATSALYELVKTFPMVSFHQTSQRFAVGTADNIIIIYDLRTATRWKMLSGHKARVSAVKFSEDGNLIASYSSPEKVVRIWQCVSVGFLGGLLGITGRCVKKHSLPGLKLPRTQASTLQQLTHVTLDWRSQDEVLLVRENKERVFIKVY